MKKIIALIFIGVISWAGTISIGYCDKYDSSTLECVIRYNGEVDNQIDIVRKSDYYLIMTNNSKHANGKSVNCNYYPDTNRVYCPSCGNKDSVNSLDDAVNATIMCSYNGSY